MSQFSLVTWLPSNSMKYWSIFEGYYDSIRNEYIAAIDWNLRQKINEIHDLDQKYRDKHELHPWNFLWRPLIWIKWKKTSKKIDARGVLK